MPAAPRLTALALAGLLAGCGASDPGSGPTSAPTAAPTSAPTSSTSPSAVAAAPLDTEAVRAETARALAQAPPAIDVRGGGLGFGLDGAGGIDVGGTGVAGVNAADAAAQAALEVLTRTPGLLRFDTPRTAEDLEPLTRLVHPDLRPSYDAAVTAFLGSAYNDPALPAPDQAADDAVGFLQGLSCLFVLSLGSNDEGLSEGQAVRDNRFIGFGGDGASAYGDLVIVRRSALDPTADSVLISLPFTSQYQTVGLDGGLRTTAVVTKEFQLRMKLSGGQWLIADYGVDGREGRTVPRRG